LPAGIGQRRDCDAYGIEEILMKLAMNVALLVIGSLTASLADAQNARPGELEFSIAAAHNFSDSFQGVGGSSLDLSSRTGIRVGVEYFNSSKLSFGFDAAWSKPSFDAVLVPEDGSPDVTINHRASIFTGHFTGTYYFVDNEISPWVEGGLGWTYFDSNVSDGAPIVGCWWDPWWGYICSDFYSTYGATNFSYGAGVGLRWNYGMDRAVNLGYRWLEVEADGLGKKPVLETAALEFVFRF
jgi:opacity protein-like surface antigen